MLLNYSTHKITELMTCLKNHNFQSWTVISCYLWYSWNKFVVSINMNYSGENGFGLTEKNSLPHTQTEKRVRCETVNIPCDISLTGGPLGGHFYNCFRILTCFKNAIENIFNSEGVLFLVLLRRYRSFVISKYYIIYSYLMGLYWIVYFKDTI